MKKEVYLTIDFTDSYEESIKKINECIKRKSIEYDDAVLKQLVEDFDWLIKKEALTIEDKIVSLEKDSYYEGFEDGKNEVWEEAYDQGYEEGYEAGRA